MAIAGQARPIDLKAARLGLAGVLLDDVSTARAPMHATEVPRGVAHMAKAVGALIGSHVKPVVVDRDDSSGVDAAQSMLGKLATAIGVAVSEDASETDGEAP